MKNVLLAVLGITFIGWMTGCGASAPVDETPEAEAKAVAAAADEEMSVEMGCAMCTYEQEGVDRCLTAAKIGDKVYLVDSDLDAHSAGLCKAPKNATVAAHIDGDRLVVSAVTFE